MSAGRQPLPFHLFDRDAEVLIVHRSLPHWGQAGAIAFVTWRTVDSMPKKVLDEWRGDRQRWLKAHGVDDRKPDWRQLLDQLDPDIRKEFLDTQWNRWHDALDACHGACVLRRPKLAEVVGKSLRHFDGDRYLLLDYVVMPNHLHLLASFPNESAMLSQCESWKHYTARQINRGLGETSHFWQSDAFDHLVRSEKQFEFLRRYIAANPERAKLPPGDTLHYSRPLPQATCPP
ncbi:MAG TPA: transposase [Pirellulales bacterium]|jgi:REP element-mobilizing transposase RayT|nr:transposase [Pirellulales bacterium]